MYQTIRELQAQWLTKSLIYESLKSPLPFSKQFQKNRRIFNELDIEIFQYYKIYGSENTVLKFWTSQNTDNKKQFQNSSKTITTPPDVNIKDAIKIEMETVIKQFKDKEEELNNTITQKNEIIKIKDEQTQKYALLKQEEKKDKEQWIEKFNISQDEKWKWIIKFYNVKMFMIIFLILFLISTFLLISIFMSQKVL